MIDEDPELADAMSDLRDAQGYEVHTAWNGREGIEKARSENPDIILLDVMMAAKHEGLDVARDPVGDHL